MRGRCERHQLALGPNGCALCRRAAAAENTVAEPAEPAAEPLGAGDGGRPSMASGGPPQSVGPRRILLQLPGFTALLPLVAGALYFFVFFAGTKAAAPELEGDGAPSSPAPLAAEERAPFSGANVKEPTSQGFRTLIIEEPSAPERRPLQGAPAEAGAASADSERAQAQSPRALAQARKQAEARELAEMRERVDVVVYSTAWCPACRSLRTYLAQHGIRATEYDIERNREAQARQRALNPRGGVPTVDVDGQVLVGFSPRSLEAALDRAARARLQRL